MIQQIQKNLQNNFGNYFELLEKDNVPFSEDIKKGIKNNIDSYYQEKFFRNAEGSLAKYIDHTYLKPECSYGIIEKLVNEAHEHHFASVCIPPSFIPYAKTVNPDVPVATVIGFPLGYTFSETKLRESEQALQSGADELDMVINVGFLKEKQYYYIYNEIYDIKKLCGNKKLKVIIETCFLTAEEKAMASLLSYLADADFIKTSTGFGSKGAVLEDIILMKMIYGNREVKASGGVKTLDFARELVKHGATRIGTSSGIELVK